ncbi:L-seryl-tRNA(Sec) selenium transferase [Paenibacillus sp. TRM 82003]|uniref:L-seryl-tRNA(Sec) selenium transferase n=1 Tax=Kineococcus sp. TRM81007 TaxID=2925831 RepID=UPI001F55C3ED|nr:L-seryl-tRNA(Sec) selenium transferase [Kineococcus sp. TRM81007]MCI2240645.1 L-seryl-tRNA(Sec) selenium transferase [Kineococcus sp. TRM81007]MCI3925432.1 L-seryl-tRNA(Sec) selenium transferase [Paenibacillus sp. TRM 82003]
MPDPTRAPRDPRRAVPRTDAVLAAPELAAAIAARGRDAVKAAVREVQGGVRAGEVAPADVVPAVLAALPAPSSVRRVLNCTGTVLHTNLGRAQLAPEAVDAVVTASGATDVELDLTTGRRARRGRGALAALREAVPAAGDVHVVNNGAAALVLAATALAAGREVVVSRGEMVEIGDGFRLPDLLVSTGARLREVGTTNRTTLADYAAAVGPGTGMVLKVHPSNFVVTGFTSGVEAGELTGLGVPVVADIGSGLLRPEPLLPDEPDATTALTAGADLVTASGDKLLGGPQAGLLLGRADLVERLRRHPLARALRVDKLTLAALEATVRTAANPTRDALRADPAGLRERCAALAATLRGRGVAADVVDAAAVVGGGGAPGVELPSAAVALDEALALPLRVGEPPVVGRVERGRLLLDLRCVDASADAEVAGAVLRVAAAGGAGA